jgi:hypothetical protein
MLDRVVVNVIHVMPVIRVIPYRMFPKPPLPDTLFSFIHAALGTAFGLGQLARKGRFDLPPTSGEIVVTLGQDPDTVHVVRQYHDSLHRKRVGLLDLAESSS